MTSKTQPARSEWTDEQVDQWIGRLLQLGVMLSATLVAAGGIWYLAGHANAPADHEQFHGEPASLRDINDILVSIGRLNSLDLIQLGLLTLILTPIARVAFTVVAFVVRRDYVFVAITLLVLAILLATLFGAALMPG
ncbi:MAG TPA: DUF1634 domain-containing protein [Pirellulales bacterium]